MAFKMKGWSPFNQNEDNLIEKLKKRMKKTQIFSDEQKERRSQASFGKKLHKDILKSITNMPEEKKESLYKDVKKKISKKK